MQQAYKTAVEEWIKTMKSEEDLASVHPTVAPVDSRIALGAEPFRYK